MTTPEPQYPAPENVQNGPADVYADPNRRADSAPDDVYADAARRADTAVRDAETYAAPEDTGRPVGEDEVVDDSPVLADVDPAYVKTNDGDGVDLKAEVDLSDMPKLRSFQHELPSARFTMVARAVEVIGLLPDELLKGKKGKTDIFDAEDGEVDLSKLASVTAIAKVVPEMERYVIDMAADREEMTKWLIERGDYNVVMAAFNVAQAHVKN